MNPWNSAHSQPLRMAPHVLKRGDLSNLRHERGKRHTMVMMFDGGDGSDVYGIPVLFLR